MQTPLVFVVGAIERHRAEKAFLEAYKLQF
jgi:hypothetical protein